MTRLKTTAQVLVQILGALLPSDAKRFLFRHVLGWQIDEEVKDGDFFRAAGQNLLKVEQVTQGNRAVQAKDAGIRRAAGNDVKAQRFVIHSIRDCRKRGARFDDNLVNTTSTAMSVRAGRTLPGDVNHPWTI